MDFINIIGYSALISLGLSIAIAVIMIFINELYSIRDSGCRYKTFIAWVKDNWDNYLSALVSIWGIVFLIVTLLFELVYIKSPGELKHELKQELIAMHEKEKCPECVYVSYQAYYKWSKETNRREKIKIDFRWLKCPKLEAELKEKLKRD